MRIPVTDLITEQGVPLRSVLAQLDRTAMGFLFVVDKVRKLTGVLSDGDVRRALLRGVLIDDPVVRAMSPEYISLPVDSDSEAIGAALSEKIVFIPLVDRDGKPVDYVSRNHLRHYPLAEPLLDGNEANYVLECVQSRWISSQGRFVRRFEKMMVELNDMPYALAVSSGTTALHLALISLGISPGDEVIVPDFTFAASANAVIHAGATPVLVDVDLQTWTIDVAAAERAITPRTRAIMPVHLYGHPCQMDSVMDLARWAKLFVVEDCAEALGSRFNDRLVGTFGDAACFSFFGNKTLTTGEGGIVLFSDAKTYEQGLMLRDHGMLKERRYWHLEVGYNYRLTNLQAAVGVAQLERAQEIFARKRALAKWYDGALMGMEGINLPPRASWADPTCWLYTVTVDESLGLTRDELVERLLRNGIETRPLFFPLHQMPPYARLAVNREFPVTERLAYSGLSLPSAVTLRETDIDAIVANLKNFVETHKLVVNSGVLL